mgnify:CR=1 FL=1
MICRQKLLDEFLRLVRPQGLTLFNNYGVHVGGAVWQFRENHIPQRESCAKISKFFCALHLDSDFHLSYLNAQSPLDFTFISTLYSLFVCLPGEGLLQHCNCNAARSVSVACVADPTRPRPNIHRSVTPNIGVAEISQRVSVTRDSC